MHATRLPLDQPPPHAPPTRLSVIASPCSRSFQKFAIKSSAAMAEMAKKSAEKKAALGQVASEHVVEKGGHFWKASSGG